MHAVECKLAKGNARFQSSKYLRQIEVSFNYWADFAIKYLLASQEGGGQDLTNAPPSHSWFRVLI